MSRHPSLYIGKGALCQKRSCVHRLYENPTVAISVLPNQLSKRNKKTLIEMLLSIFLAEDWDKFRVGVTVIPRTFSGEEYDDEEGSHQTLTGGCSQ